MKSEMTRGKQEELEFIPLLASTAAYYGKFKHAEELGKRAFEIFKLQGRNENFARGQMAVAGNLMLVGRCDEAKQKAKTALSTVRAQMIVANAALIFASCDDQGQAQSLLDEMRKLYPRNTVIASIITPMLRAEAERSRGNIDQAIQLLESIRGYDMGMITGMGNIYARGNLYLKQRRGNEAASEFQKIIGNPGVDSFSPAHVLAHLGLGRAAAINGDMAAARKAYQDFFA